MDLYSTRQGILDLPPEEALELVKDLRMSRRNSAQRRAATRASARSKLTTSTLLAVDELSLDDLESLMETING